MTLSYSQLAHEALQLPVASRAELAEQLVESLAAADAGELQTVWGVEAVRRRDEVRAGVVKAIPGEHVLAEVRRAVGRE